MASERTKDKELKNTLRNAEKMFKELSVLDAADRALQNKVSPTESDKGFSSLSSPSSKSAPLVEEEHTADLSGDEDASDRIKNDDDTECDDPLKECNIEEYPRDDTEIECNRLEDFVKNKFDSHIRSYADDDEDNDLLQEEDSLLKDEDDLLRDDDDRDIELYEPETVY